MKASIVLNGLCKKYGRRTIVDGVSADVHTGEIVGLLGPNGAGKTTTFYMVVGLVKPDSGTVELHTSTGSVEDLTKRPMYARARSGIGYLAQENSIFRKLSVGDNIRLIWEMNGISQAEREARLPVLLGEFGLAHLIDARADSLSGGERRRCEIARALATNPAFLLLDEPFTGIDPIAVGEIQIMIRQLRDRGLGVLITDHQVRETLAIVDRAYIMSSGDIVVSGSANEVMENELARRFYLGEASGYSVMKTLDRYLITELGGPSLFGLSAFSLIFAATYILSISRLVADEHAPLWAAVEYFIFQIPQIVILVIPMALLLGTLLALGRLSGDSELTAMKAGGIGLQRMVRPLLGVGLAVSILSLGLQELLVPFAQERASFLLNDVIRHVGVIARTLDVTTSLPGGGRQLTAATSYEASSGTLENVTVIQYDRENVPQQIIFSKRARFTTDTWTFADARTYHFASDGSTVASIDPQLTVDIGEQPNQILQRASNDNPDELSRAQIHDILSSDALNDDQKRKYRSAYDAKLAQPFACLVFTLIAIPFGLRRVRGGGTSMGFGLAVAIVFVYYIILTVCRGLASSFPASSIFWAWTPNFIFTAIGLVAGAPGGSELMGALGGSLVVVFITLLAGAIAYVGDRVGHVVGRRRLSLFGLRPRHTSTIFAIGTGMLIALTVTIFSLIVSTYVQTAFFRIGQLNDRVNTLEAEATALDRHTHDENVVINRGDLVYGAVLILRPAQSPAERTRALSAFFEDTIHYVNAAYGSATLGNRGLRPNVANVNDPAIAAKLHEVLIDVEPKLQTMPVLVLAVADRNLFPHDEIHFRLQGLADRKIFSANEAIAALPITSKNINPKLIMTQLASAAAAQAIAHGLPYYFANPLLVMDPSRLRTVTDEISDGEGDVLVARAASDVYPDRGSLPIDFVLVKKGVR